MFSIEACQHLTKHTHSICHSWGAQKHIPRTIPRFWKKRGHETLLLFSWGFLISTQNSPGMIDSILRLCSNSVALPVKVITQQSRVLWAMPAISLCIDFRVLPKEVSLVKSPGPAPACSYYHSLCYHVLRIFFLSFVLSFFFFLRLYEPGSHL